MIFVDALSGDQARAFTDSSLNQLHKAAHACRVPQSAFQKPRITGDRVTAGGYYLVSAKQHRKLVERGAVLIGPMPADAPLSDLLIVARATLN